MGRAGLAAAVALLVALALPVHAQFVDIEGAMKSVLPEEATQVDTVAEGLAIDVAAPLDPGAEAQVYGTAGVLFVPLDEAAKARLWSVAVEASTPRMLGRLSAVILPTDGDGRVTAIDKLTTVALRDGAQRLFAIPGTATHLEIAVSDAAKLLFSADDIGELAEATAPMPGPWLRAPGQPRLDLAAPVEPGAEDGARTHLRAVARIPDNYTATVTYRIGRGGIEYPLTGEAEQAAPPATTDAALTGIAIALARPKVFGDDPWPDYRVRFERVALAVDEAEPNDGIAQANPIDWAAGERRVTREGYATRASPDFWALDVDAARAAEGLQITADFDGIRGGLTLQDADGQTLVQTVGSGKVALSDLVLAEGRYVLRVATDAALAPYTLRAKARRAPGPDREAEPNGVAAWARDLPLGTPVAGGAAGDDVDFYRFTVTEPGRLFALQASGGPALVLMLDTGQAFQSQGARRDGKLTQIGSQRLPRGTYLIKVSGAERYGLLIRDTGPVPEDFEHEPNADFFEAPLLEIGQSMRGSFGSSSDADSIGFSIDAPQFVRIRIETPDDTPMRATLRYMGYTMVGESDSSPGQTSDQVFFLEPGDYTITLTRLTSIVSRDLWKISLSHPDFAHPFEHEPNAQVPTVTTVGQRVTGNQFGLDGYDSYLIDLPAEPGEVFYHCATLEGGEIEVAVLPPGTAWRRKLLDYEKLWATGRRDAVAGEAGARYAVSHRNWGAGTRGYDCAARWHAPGTRAAVLDAAPPRVTESAKAAGFDPAHRLSLPARIAYVLDGNRQGRIRRMDLPEGTEQIAITCEVGTSNGAIYVHTPDGARLGYANNADPTVFDAGGHDHLFLWGWAHRFATDGPTMQCAVQAANGGALTGAAPDTVPETVLTPDDAVLRLDGSARVLAAKLPGKMGEKQPAYFRTTEPTQYDAGCRLDGEGVDADQAIGKAVAVTPGKEAGFTIAFKGVTAARPVTCDFLDMADLPMLPLGERAGPMAAPAVVAAPPAMPFAALVDIGQAQGVTVTLTNPNDAPLPLDLAFAVTDAGWTVVDPPAAVTLDPGEARDIAVALQAPPYLSSVRTPVLMVATTGGEARETRTALPLPVEIGAAPVGARTHWSVDPALAGGLNVAWASLGGAVTAYNDGKAIRDPRHYAAMIDGNGPRNAPKYIDRGHSLTIDLAGEDPVPLAGLAYTLRVQTIHHPTPPRALEVLTSRDGEAFESLGTFALSTSPRRQDIAFDAPVEATHVRLRREGCTARACIPLTDLAVIADPDWTGGSLVPPNVADPALGGMVIAHDADTSINISDMLTATGALRIDPPGVVEGAEPPEDAGSIVVGFHRARAPQVARIVWSNPEGLADEVDHVILAIGDDPMVPGEAIGRLERPAPGEDTTLALPEGTTARYLFVTFPHSDGSRSAPGHLQVFERAPGPEYRSILGLWDEDDRRGHAEWLRRDEAPAPAPLPEKTGGTEDAPRPLPPATAARSVTSKENAPDWYAMAADEGADTPALRLVTLGAPGIVEVGAALIGPDGEVVPLELADTLLEDEPALRAMLEAGIAGSGMAGDRDRVTFVARVDPSRPYRLRIGEEGRLLILRREVTSMISRADGVRRRAYRELADLMGDGSDGLSLGLQDRDGTVILRGEEEILFAMSRVPKPEDEGKISTSDFGTALAADAQRLRVWPGGKGIVYFGMGAGMAQKEDMDWVYAVEDVPARTSAILVPCNDGNFFCPAPGTVEPFPMHFAAATGGRFLRTVTQRDIRDGLLNAAYALRGPKVYSAMWMDAEAPPEPATLTLAALPGQEPEREGEADPEVTEPETEAEEDTDPDAPPPVPALSLVLDASGSMLKRLDGTRRIEIARAALRRLVDDTIPDTAEVSFRAFGLAKDGCLTQELAPLAPLDRGALAAAIDGVRAINLARTPIADSLAAAAADIAGATGPRSIILLTDGEETCDGSVDDTLSRLAAEGFVVTLHIVGFAIDDDALRADFERWAAATGGTYFDAQDRGGLESAVADAVTVAVAPEPPAPPPPEEVTVLRLDAEDGAEPVVLRFGDGATLAPGTYALRLPDGRTIERELAEGADVTVALEDFTPAPPE